MKQTLKPVLGILCSLVFCGPSFSQEPSLTVDAPVFRSIDSLNPEFPVEIVRYLAAPSGKNQISIAWTTTKEEQLDYFRLERSGNGTDFTTIAIIRGAGKATAYTQVDEEPLSGENHYRLSCISKEGKTALFDVLRIRLHGLQGTMALNPNPATEQVQLQLSSEERGMITASIFNNSGMLVKQWILNKPDEVLQQSFPVTDLQPGNYIFQVKVKFATETRQFVKK